jgi:hypothetical protein
MEEAAHIHIEAIRSRIREERAEISKMNAELGDNLKRMLRSAESLLDDVEHFFLAPSVLREQRSAGQWRYWLSNAEIVLKRAVAQRLHVHRLAEKMDPHAQLI